MTPAATPFSYAEVGATREFPLPAGYSHLRVRTRVGHGDAAFRAAAAALAEWRMHRAVPVRIEASTRRAEPGARVTVTLAWLVRAPCEIVWTADEPDRYAWAYGTLPGHPECGEEAFVVTREPSGEVFLDVLAFSRPGGRLARVLGPLVPVFQRAYARRCGRVLARLARQGSVSPSGCGS